MPNLRAASLTVSLAGFALLPISARSTLVHHASPALSNSAVVARIVSNKAVYRLGDPIKLRLTLTNKSGERLYISGSPPPFWLLTLTIFDASGRPLQHGGRRTADARASMLSWNLAPGKPVVIDFSDPENHWRRTDWADVKYWGYSIKTPGTYTLVATPEIQAFGPGDEFNDAPARESNKVRIAIIRGGASSYDASTTHPTCPTVGVSLTHAVQPEYPASARNFGAASVEVEVTVGEAGNLLETRVVKSSGNALIDDAALRAARESSYSPKFVHCQPTQGSYLFRAIFQRH